MSSLKTQVLSSFLWSAIQKIGALIVSFFTNLVLARILSPDDFGNIGILLIFIVVCQAFVDGGFGAALIQRKGVSDADYSTVFYWNLFVAAMLVIIIYFVAPIIGTYYKSELLCNLLRVQSLTIFINAFSLVQTAKLTKELNFKVLSVRSIISVTVGASIAVMLAYNGWGVWSLVIKEIVSATVGVLLLWLFCKWYPSLVFDKQSFKEMFQFGFLILISSIVGTVYRNIQSLIIGKVFSFRDLGYYTQARKMEEIPVQGGTMVLTQVLFPVYSSLAGQYEYMKSIVRKNVIIITFLTFPVMILLILLASPLLTILFTNKWAASIPLFQILCIEGMFFPLNCANTEIFKAIGKSSIYFILQTVKRVVSLVIIIYSVQYGLYPMMWTVAITGILFYIVNVIFTHRIFGYKMREQLIDIMPNLVLSIIIGLFIFILLIIANISNGYMLILFGSCTYMSLYLFFSIILKFKGVKLMWNIIKNELIYF